MQQTFPTVLSGYAHFDTKTKDLVKRIPADTLALLQHEDIDEVAAHSLITKKIKGLLNCAASMSGTYFSTGTSTLLEAGIPVFDVLQPDNVKQKIKQFEHGNSASTGIKVTIHNNELWFHEGEQAFFISRLIPYCARVIQHKNKLAQQQQAELFRQFTLNTLAFARQELDVLLKRVCLPSMRTSIQNRPVLVVGRGKHYVQDLQAVLPFIEYFQPVLIGIDGGADALLHSGYKPDLIIGDMDSVSQQALYSGAELIVHAYPDGRAPGLEQLPKDLSAHVFRCLGTSEDAALMLAYEAGARLIASIGSHMCMQDFLEKGRSGMGSTLLIRMKVGDRLVDAKGLAQLFPPEIWSRRNAHGTSQYYHSSLSRGK